jgi:hypothetical protein
MSLNITPTGSLFPYSQDDLLTYWYYDTEDPPRLIYICRARPGTATTATGWQIRKFSYTDTNDYPDTVKFASGSNNFDFICDSKGDYTYS